MPLKKKQQAQQSSITPPPAMPQGRAARAKAKRKGGQHFVLLVGDDGAILVFIEQNSVQRRLFAPSAQLDHCSSMIELLNANPKAPLSIVCDVLDQQYVRHSFPPVSSLTVGGLVKRRLERDFQAEDLKGSLPLGRDKSGRKEWNFLLISLSYTATIQQWVELLIEQPNELKGVYLLPVESQRYIAALKKTMGGEQVSWQLLFTHNKVSGFRQVVVRDGKLVFTRSTQAPDDANGAIIAGSIEQEILNTIEYLRRLGFQDASSLEVFIIAAQEVKEAIDINRFKAGLGHVMIPAEVAEMLNLRQAALSADRFGDVVFAGWFGQDRKHILRLATAYLEKLQKLYVTRRALKAVAAVVILAAIGMLGLSISEVQTYQQTTEESKRRLLTLQQDVDKEKGRVNDLGTDVKTKTAVAALYETTMKDSKNPLDFVSQLDRAMPADMRLSNMDWTRVIGNGTAPAAGASHVTGPLEIKTTVELARTYKDIDTLTKAVDMAIAALRQAMPQYDLVISQYSWLKDDAGMEISLGNAQNTNASDVAPTVEIIFYGPKPSPAGEQDTP